jgi:polyphosphate kinase
MFRNLSKRVEVVTPVEAPGPKARLWEILDICLRDKRQSWTLETDGSYTRTVSSGSSEGSDDLGVHQTLMNRARACCK